MRVRGGRAAISSKPLPLRAPPVKAAPRGTRCLDWKRRYPINDGAPFPKSGPIGHFHLTQALSDELPADTLIVTGSSGTRHRILLRASRTKEGRRVFLTSGPRRCWATACRR